MIEINWNGFIQSGLPRNLRTVMNLQWIQFLFAPTIRIYNELQALFMDVRYELSFNGQVIYLEKLLNQTFNNDGDEIYIEDGPVTETYIYNENELNEETYLTNEDEAGTEVYLYNEDESSGTEIGFIVNVPSSLPINEPQLIALINAYKLAGISYTINYY